MRIIIMAAMDSEIAAILPLLEAMSERQYARASLYYGQYQGHEFLVANSGIGTVNAARLTQLAIDKFCPDALLHIGIGGALLPEMQLGEIVLGAEICYHDMQEDVLEAYEPYRSRFASDATLLEAAQAMLEEIRQVEHRALTYRVGGIATGNHFVQGTAMRDDIQARTGAAIVDMESAAVAQVACLNDVPCLVIRSVSDFADEGAEETYEKQEISSAELAAHLVRDLVSRL